MYDKKYDERSIRSENSDFVEFMLPHLGKEKRVVDLGCGTCRKVAKIAPYVDSVDALDRNERMLAQAADSLAEKKIDNVRLFLGDNFNTPFVSNTYDVCSTALSTWSPAEARRLLKTGGTFFIETLCPDDKFEIKKAFGQDDLGERGYLFGQTCEERVYYLRTALEAFFEVEEWLFTERQTELTEEGFLGLLELTPTIRGFSLEKDGDIVKRLLVDGKVRFTEKRMMIRATASRFKPS
ncbi:MAG: class I SAM-dependent methyltransferase [Clostridia bacterium]|nr:class I SAM-dependent methyltransferase [Clostridia bacterium]